MTSSLLILAPTKIDTTLKSHEISKTGVKVTSLFFLIQLMGINKKDEFLYRSYLFFLAQV